MEKIITIIGFGNVGRFIATLLLPYTQCRFTINVMDPDEGIKGAILDIDQGMAFFPNHCLVHNRRDLMLQSDFIFHCAGAAVPKGQSRLATSRESVEMTKKIFKEYVPKQAPFIIVVANPVEVITTVTQKVTGLAPERIIGTGTALDSIRMNRFIQQEYPEFRDVDMKLLGEHGSSVFMSHQLSRIQGEPVNTVLDTHAIAKLMARVKQAAYEIKQTQEATIYGVSYCAIQIFKAILLDETITLPVSTFPADHLKTLLVQYPIALSLNAQVNGHGARPDLSYFPDEKETTLLKSAADVILKYTI